MKSRTKKILNEVSSMIRKAYPFLTENERNDMLENFVCRCIETEFNSMKQELPEDQMSKTRRLNLVSQLVNNGDSIINTNGSSVNQDAVKNVKQLPTNVLNALNLSRQDISKTAFDAAADAKKNKFAYKKQVLSSNPNTLAQTFVGTTPNN